MYQNIQLPMLLLFHKILIGMKISIHKINHHFHIILRVIQEHTTHLNLLLLVLIPHTHTVVAYTVRTKIIRKKVGNLE